MLKTKNKTLLLCFLVLITIISFVLRFKGITLRTPFWVDEFSTARSVRNILKYGLSLYGQKDILVEGHNITTYFLAAFFYKFFGSNEFSTRLPFVIIGSLIPVIVYLSTKKIFDKTTAACASILTTFSYFMITWSRQAREFALLQLLALLSIYLYFMLISSKKKRLYLILLFLCLIFGVMTHVIFYLLILALLFFTLTTRGENLNKLLRKPIVTGFLLLILLLSIIAPWNQGIVGFFHSGLFGANNFWYYHSFLWREYGLITFLGLSGLLIGVINKKGGTGLLLIHFIFQLIFVSFIWGHYLSKYLLPVFPYLLMGTGYFISYVSDKVLENRSRTIRFFVPVLITLFIVVNGYKFVIKPKSYYSINHDFREIANIDYDQVYKIIKEKGELDKKQTAMVETWPDRAYWYLGNNYPAVYYFRWENEKGKENGHEKKTSFYLNNEGEKEIVKNLRFIGNVSDLKKVMIKYPKGFIFIDDSTLPKDVIEYTQMNFKKELYLDHYPLDDNPYSIWPATLYSWGI